MLRVIPILVGVIAAYVVALLVSMVDFSAEGNGGVLAPDLQGKHHEV